MGKLRRKQCDGTKCTDPAFFNTPSKSAGVDPFFKSTVASDAPAIDPPRAFGLSIHQQLRCGAQRHTAKVVRCMMSFHPVEKRRDFNQLGTHRNEAMVDHGL